MLDRIENDDKNFNNLKIISIAIIVSIAKITKIKFSDEDIKRLSVRIFYNLGIMEKLKGNVIYSRLAEANSKTVSDSLMEVISKYTKDYTYKSEVSLIKEKLEKKEAIKKYSNNLLDDLENSLLELETKAKEKGIKPLVDPNPIKLTGQDPAKVTQKEL